MANGKNTPPPSSSRERKTISEEDKDNTNTGRAGTAGAVGDPNAKELPGGKDPRDPQYPGKYSTSENVTTDEQEAAQEAYRKKDGITSADVGPYATAPRAEQVESQRAAAENPLAPQSTTISEPHNMGGGGLDNPPAPEGFKSPIPMGNKRGWNFDPLTGERLQHGSRRARLEDEEDDEDEVEVELVGPVTLTDDHGTQHKYEGGKQKMPRAHAEHWYIKSHAVQKKSEDKSAARKSAEAGDREERSAKK